METTDKKLLELFTEREKLALQIQQAQEHFNALNAEIASMLKKKHEKQSK